MSRISAFMNKVALALESKQARLERGWRQKQLENNELMRTLMKPDDGVIGYMFDDDKPRGVVMAVDKDKFFKHYQSLRKDAALNQRQIRSAAKAFKANNDLHLMATFFVDEHGAIQLLEGNHRLALLQFKPVFLINVINERHVSEAEFAEHLKMIAEKVGAAELAVKKNPDAVFCHVDFDDSGHCVRILEERQREPYFTVHAKPKSEPAPAA